MIGVVRMSEGAEKRSAEQVFRILKSMLIGITPTGRAIRATPINIQHLPPSGRNIVMTHANNVTILNLSTHPWTLNINMDNNYQLIPIPVPAQVQVQPIQQPHNHGHVAA